MGKIAYSSGFVNVLKPTGMTSSDVVVSIKKILGIKKVGHLGTLDPAASGVLPIAFGKATKLFNYFLNKEKKYVAIVQFGIETDTLDSFANITNINDKKTTRADINKKIKLFLGKIKQTPPKYSAVKINGKKAYDLARAGKKVEIEPREIEIYSIKVLDELTQNRFRFEVHCSAGTYIRTLFDDIARVLDTRATTMAIIRTKSGSFSIENALTLDELRNEIKTISIEDALYGVKRYEIVDKELLKKIINGVKIQKNEIDIDICDDKFLITNHDKIIGLYYFDKNRLECEVFLLD